MNDFMVDLETLDNIPTAVVVQIGAIAFDRADGSIVAEFCTNVDIQSELDAGFSISGSTIGFWMQQALQGQCTWLTGGRDSKRAMQDFIDFLDTYTTKSSLIWSHSTFDAPILFYHMNKHGLRTKAHWNKWVDLRTISFMARQVTSVPASERPEDAHDALADCKYQLKWLNVCRKILKGD